MSDERWRRVQELFERALALPAAERAAILAAECGDDGALRAEVQALLAHHVISSGFLETGGADVRAFAAGIMPPPPLPEGTDIGAWRIVRTLGEGGMGTVYLAERAEGGFRQQGALKLIRQGLASEEMIRRFLRERQILATLEHPQIARLLDGGTTPDGLPWLVMEYVEGRPLYDDCSERRLSVEQRLRLFLKIASAVQYAHGRLVLHRDIKPGNLLIAADGSPRLLDFGIGKALDETLLSATQDVRTIVLPMTPEYASPEQLRGEEVGVASDVYSLGVLLYELLTGARPYAESASAREFVEQVLAREPERPSTAASTASRTRAAGGASRRLPDPPLENPVTLRRHLAGDLDNIVMKAMHRDVARRYASVEQLTLDLERYLGGYPVLARPDSWGYRWSKYLRRHRVGIAAASVAVLALVAGLGVALWQAGVAKQQRAIAERRYQLVRNLANTLIFDVNDAVAGLAGGAPVREMVLTRAVGYLDSLAKDAGADTTLALDLADAYERIGVVQGMAQQPNVGKPVSARTNYEKSLRLREGLLRKIPGSRRLLSGLVSVYTKFANMEQTLNHTEQALALHRKALAAAEKLSAAFPESRDYRANLLTRRYNLGTILYLPRGNPEGLRAMDEARQELEVMIDPDTTARLRSLLARVEWNYAQQLMTASGPTESALAALHRSESLYVDLQRRAPHDRDLQLRRAINLGLLSMIALYRQRQPEPAWRYASASSEIIDTLSIADAGNKDMELNRAIARFLVGYMAAVAGRLDEAAPILRESRTRWSAMAAVPDLRPTAFAELESSDEADSWMAEHRARDAELHGEPSRGHWRSARRLLGKAYAAFDSMNSGGESGTLIIEQRGIMLERLAHMDSVLAPPRR